MLHLDHERQARQDASGEGQTVLCVLLSLHVHTRLCVGWHQPCQCVLERLAGVGESLLHGVLGEVVTFMGKTPVFMGLSLGFAPAYVAWRY